MHITALLSFLLLWTEMAAVHAGETETSCGQLITVRATGSELTATGFSCEPDAPPISSRFMSAVGLVSLPECGSHFRGTSGSVASCGAVSPFPLAAPESLELFDEHFISRCAAT
eukprot:SAG11_NODE_6152_length_1375_cov_56.235110_1_plen_114_part_00